MSSQQRHTISTRTHFLNNRTPVLQQERKSSRTHLSSDETSLHHKNTVSRTSHHISHNTVHLTQAHSSTSHHLKKSGLSRQYDITSQRADHLRVLKIKPPTCSRYSSRRPGQHQESRSSRQQPSSTRSKNPNFYLSFGLPLSTACLLAQEARLSRLEEELGLFNRGFKVDFEHLSRSQQGKSTLGTAPAPRARPSSRIQEID